MFDVIIIGIGPAGLSAAIYTSRANLKTLCFGILKNSNAHKASIFENYMGFAKRISGPFLMEESKQQAERFGAELIEREVVDIQMNNNQTFTVVDTEEVQYETKTILICSGLGFKPSGIKKEKELTGRGISFCVVCDGALFRGKHLAVIGSGNYAGDEALQLTNYSPDVTLLSHGYDFSFSKALEEALAKSSVKRLRTPRITEFLGTERLEKLRFVNGTEMNFDGVFMALGIATAADFAIKLGIERTGTQNAFLKADSRTGETNVPRVYAAGDCTGGNAQAAKSAGEGCNAAISIIKLLKGVKAYVDYD